MATSYTSVNGVREVLIDIFDVSFIQKAFFLQISAVRMCFGPLVRFLPSLWIFRAS